MRSDRTSVSANATMLTTPFELAMCSGNGSSSISISSSIAITSSAELSSVTSTSVVASPSSTPIVASSLSSSAIGRPSGNALSMMPLIRAAITKLCSTDSNSSNNTDGSVTLSMKVRSINMASADETMSGSKSVLLPSASAIAPVEEKLIVSRRLVIMSP